jgi:hypothetical protein
MSRMVGDGWATTAGDKAQAAGGHIGWEAVEEQP